jgi:hypothetical protein
MDNVFVKPRAPNKDNGETVVIVRDPVSRLPLRPDGEWKEATQYWLQRIAEGDVIDVTAAQKKLQVDEDAKAKADAGAAAAAAQLAADQKAAGRK